MVNIDLIVTLEEGAVAEVKTGEPLPPLLSPDT